MKEKEEKKPNRLLQVLSTLTTRLGLAGYFGSQYGGDRDIFEALGYPTTLAYQDFWSKYERMDLAKAIIDRPVNMTWRGELQILETDKKEETKFEKAWEELEKSLKLKAKFKQVDKLVGIGEYGLLLLGFDDIQNREQFAMPVGSGKKALLYVKPIGQSNVTIKSYVEDTKDKRYGMPKLYSITLTNSDGSSTYTIEVHFSRVIHIVDDPILNETLGTPRLEVVYNRLMDLEKLVGGSAEMFWRGARPGYTGEVDPDYTLPDTDTLKEEVDEYEHNLRRIFIHEGVKLKTLETQVADPKNHVDIQIQMISAVTGIPKRILTGSERGELSSSQDSDEWAFFIQERRENFAEPNIVRAFIDTCIKYGILPNVEYQVLWQDLFAKSEKDRADIGARRATALREYLTNPMAEAVVPPDAFFELFLGLTQEQIELVKTMAQNVQIEEIKEALKGAAGKVTDEPEEETQEEEEKEE